MLVFFSYQDRGGFPNYPNQKVISTRYFQYGTSKGKVESRTIQFDISLLSDTQLKRYLSPHNYVYLGDKVFGGKTQTLESFKQELGLICGNRVGSLIERSGEIILAILKNGMQIPFRTEENLLRFSSVGALNPFTRENVFRDVFWRCINYQIPPKAVMGLIPPSKKELSWGIRVLYS